MLHSGRGKRILALIMVMVLSFSMVSSAVRAETEDNTGTSASSGQTITTTLSAGDDDTATDTDAGTGAGVSITAVETDDTTDGTEAEESDEGIMLTAEEITVSVTDVTSQSRSTTTMSLTLLDQDENTMATYSASDVQYYTTGNNNNRTYYYLIPVSYLEETFGNYGYTFDDAEVSSPSFVYGTTTTYSSATAADYVSVTQNGTTTYYLRVSSTRTELSSVNIFYTETWIVTDTVNPSGTVIHLFDYWSTTNSTDPDRTDYTTGGINNGRTLKFVANGASGYNGNSFNTWTGNASVFQNITQRVLVNGYPSLNAAVTGSTESLDYLFDPSVTSAGKATYENVQGLLQIDDQGYYYYDSSKNYAEFDTSTNAFTLYSTWAFTYLQNDGQFFPFNSFSSTSKTQTPQENYTSTGAVINHYFGIAMTTRFIQRYHGHTSSEESESNETTFEFSGDDDVWIYVDDVLIGDVGGIHDMSTISINFATGEIVINEGTSYEINTTIYAQFVAAGMENTVTWNDDKTTFADNTYHTLKFYYLERGNTASNLKLKYNLIEIPESTIEKVDQYGDPVEGASFAIYEARIGEELADGEYTYYYVRDNGVSYYDSDTMTTHSDGTVVEEATAVSAKLKSGVYQYEYDASNNTGNIMYGATVIYTAKYTGTTNSDGQMKFRDKYDSAYTLNELKELIGSQYFIIREIEIPEGYRMVSEEIYMEITDEGLMTCNNTYTSGVYVSAIEQVTATDRIYYSDTSGGTAVTRSVLYNDITNNKVNGVLFAVVVKYVGETMTADDWATKMAGEQSWVPVYGNDDEGYTLLDVDYNSYATTGEAFIAAAITAAQAQAQYSDVVFQTAGGTGAMQITLTCLPGDITTYYHILGDDEKQNTQYTIAYYWVDADSLSEATVDNTYRVYSDSFLQRAVEGESAPVDYDGFDRIFGATLNVPDLINRFFVQKLDEEGNLVNGATFGLYEVEEVAETTGNVIYYVASDGTTLIYLEGDEDYDGVVDNAGRAYIRGGSFNRGYTYTVNETTGVISVMNASGTVVYTINPVDVKETISARDATDPDYQDNPSREDGTACFSHVTEGCYYVRELSAPAGYTINTTEIKVMVTDEAIYGNAGTQDDGVTVARGAGYLVSNLNIFASEGDIDRTLSWIYADLLLNLTDINTFDIGDPYDDSDTDWNETNKTTYLEYDPDHETILFDYIENAGREGDGVLTRRLFTETGWAAVEIYQDSDYYEELLAAAGTAGVTYSYAYISHAITNLFSRSLYIRVTDKPETEDVEFVKIDGYTVDTTAVDSTELETQDYLLALDGVEFTIYSKVLYTDANGDSILDSSGNEQYVWEEYDYTSTEYVQATYTVGGATAIPQMNSYGWYDTDTSGNLIWLKLYVQVTDSNGDVSYVAVSDIAAEDQADYEGLPLYADEANQYVQINGGSGNITYEALSTAATASYSLVYEVEYRQQTNTNGEILYDSNGDPLYVQATDANGDVYDDAGNPVYEVRLVQAEGGDGTLLFSRTQTGTDANGDPIYEYSPILATDENGNTLYEIVYKTGGISTYVSGSDTSRAVDGLVSFTDLPEGTYRIVETDGIDGYTDSDWVWIVEITADDTTGELLVSITSEPATTADGLQEDLSTWYTFTEAYNSSITYSWYTYLDTTNNVVYYYWPNYSTTDFEFMKIDGNKVDSSQVTDGELSDTANSAVDALNGAEFTIYRAVESTDSTGNTTYIWKEYYYTTEYVQATDANGTPLTDADGNPVYETELVLVTNADGDPLYDENGDLVYEKVYVTRGISTYVSGSGGIEGLVDFTNLPAGIYKVVETGSLAEYADSSWYWIVTITPEVYGDMAVTITASQETTDGTAEGQPTWYKHTDFEVDVAQSDYDWYTDWYDDEGSYLYPGETEPEEVIGTYILYYYWPNYSAYDFEFVKIDANEVETNADSNTELAAKIDESAKGLAGVEFTIYRKETYTDADGDAILYNGNPQYIWEEYDYTTERVLATYTSGADSTVVKVDDDGNLVTDSNGNWIYEDVYVKTAEVDGSGNAVYKKVSELTANEQTTYEGALLYVAETDTAGDTTYVTFYAGRLVADTVDVTINGTTVTTTVYEYVYETEGVSTYTSDSTGIIGLVDFADLPVGTYKIVETGSANGYADATWYWIITIEADADGELSIASITSSQETADGTANGLSTWYTYTEDSGVTASGFDANSYDWLTTYAEDPSGNTSNINVTYYYWPNYTTYEFEFYKVDGDTATDEDDNVLELGTSGLTMLDDVEFTIYRNISDTAGEYTWEKYEYITSKVQAAYADTTTATTVLKYKEDGTPETDEYGDLIYLKVYVQLANVNGIVSYVAVSDLTEEDKTTCAGNPLYGVAESELDSNGDPVTGATYEPIYEVTTKTLKNTDGTALYDASGNPLYVQATDANGNPITGADNNPVYEVEYVTEQVATFVSGSNGTSGLVNLSDLPAGTYKIEETGKATGYKAAGWYWIVTVDQSGKVTLTPSMSKTNTGDITSYTYEATTADGTMSIWYWPNYLYNYKLPSSGRAGIYLPTIIGIAIMCITAAVYLHTQYMPGRRRKRAVKASAAHKMRHLRRRE